MIGKGELPLRFAGAQGPILRLANRERRFYAVDGGGGATMLAALLACGERVRRAWSPRHAQLLVVFEPVSSVLLESLVEIHRAMPRPCAMLAIADASTELFRNAGLVRMEDIFPAVVRFPSGLSALELANRMLAIPLACEATPPAPALDETTIALPDRSSREMASEPLVLSLGPAQPFTAGPLRLLLVCDGEQVDTVTLEAGYAKRRLAASMTSATLADAERLSSFIDPLAPVAGHLAYVAACEHLAHAQPGERLVHVREAALALERARNHVAWLVRFAAVLSVPWLEAHAGRLHRGLDTDSRAPETLRIAASDLATLRARIATDRALALRTAGIGVISAERLRAVGASGPVLRASERGVGDVMSRLIARVERAAEDVRHLIAAAASGVRPEIGPRSEGSAGPAGEGQARVEGPRGRIELSLESDGVAIRRIEWTRPSAALLAVVPELLAKQRLADAEVIVSSLDLSMAEADA